MSKGIELWNRAKELEARAKIRKQEAWEQIKKRFPDIQYQNFGQLAIGRGKGKLRPDVARVVEEYDIEISAIVNEAKSCREESDELLEEARNADKRHILDPSIDEIPPGPHPKLRECKMYPLRRDCNHGENAASRWERCEHMKYDNDKSILDRNRWVCRAPK